MTINDNFLEPWANGFPDPRARGNIADVFYNSALVLREHYVVVDGGRAYLPCQTQKRSKSRGDRQILCVY